MASVHQRIACLEMEVRTIEENAVAIEMASSTAVGSIKSDMLQLQLQVQLLQQREWTITAPLLTPTSVGIVAPHSPLCLPDEHAKEVSLSSRILEVERCLQDVSAESFACQASLTARMLDVESKLQNIGTTLQLHEKQQGCGSVHQPSCLGNGGEMTTDSNCKDVREIEAGLRLTATESEMKCDSRNVGATLNPYEALPSCEYQPACETNESPRVCNEHPASQRVYPENQDAALEFEIGTHFESRLRQLEEAQSQTLEMLRQVQQTHQAHQHAEQEAAVDESCVVRPQHQSQMLTSHHSDGSQSACMSAKSTGADQIALREVSAPLETSLWELGLAVGYLSNLPEGVIALVLVLLLMCIDLIICVILVEEFSEEDVTVDDASVWRRRLGHWQAFASSEGQSMVDQVCNYDMSIVMSASQSRQFGEADLYTANFFGFSLGLILCAWCILIFFFLIWEELQKSLDRVWSVLHLQRSRATRISEGGHGFIVEAVSIPRFCVILLLCAMRMTVAIVFLYAGSLWLIYTADIQDLILNSVALVFVLDIDELLYRIACPSSIKVVVEALRPLPKPSIGPLHFPSRAVSTISASALCMIVFGTIWLRPHADNVRDLKNALCGGDTGFITGVHVATGVVYAYYHGGGQDTNASILMETVNEELLQGTANNNHVEKPTYADFRSAINMPLKDMITGLGPVCNDTTIGAYLAATKDLLGSSAVGVSQCSDLNLAQCMMPPVITRMSCPNTCGCDIPFSSTFTMDGCPWHSCAGPNIQDIPCNQNTGVKNSFQDARRNLPYFDIELEVLGIVSQWNHFWQGFLTYKAIDADVPVLNLLSSQGLNRTFVTQVFQNYGCGTFLHLQKSFGNTGVETLKEFLCAMKKGSPTLLSRRSLAIFCPVTCECDACACLPKKGGGANSGAYTFCGPFCNVNGHRRRQVFHSPSVPACAGLSVRGASVIDNPQCKQNLSSLSRPINPNGFYSCYPDAYNGKHLYRYLDPAGIQWEIKWEDWTNFSWAAGILGQRIGLQKTSKWTLSTLDQRAAVPCPAPASASTNAAACPFTMQSDCFVYNRPPPSICGFPCTSLSQFRCDVQRFFSTSSSGLPDRSWFPRNSSNTDLDFDCAAGSHMTTEILPFSVSSKGSPSTCQPGYVHIHKQLWNGNATCANSVCRSAAVAIGKASQVAVVVSSQPPGCIFGSATGSNYSVMYNELPLTSISTNSTTLRRLRSSSMYFNVCIRSSAVQGLC